ncbi:MAG: hypothetical protein AAFX94_19515, partial [Myxococcota bacterium]
MSDTEEQPESDQAANPDDPMGLFELEPILTKFAEKNPEIAAAIRNADTKALREILERDRDKHPKIPELLKNRRLFVRPIKRAPGMWTVNGIGTTLYTSDGAPDGTKIGTLWFTFIFLPVVPLSQYLVYPHGGGQYSFLGSVPMGGVTRIWRRAIASIVGSAILFGAWSLYGQSQETEVHFLSGLDYPVTITVNEDRFQLDAMDHVVRTVPVGTVTFRVYGEGEQVIAESSADVPSFTSLVAYNVLGSAPLYAEGVIYSEVPIDNVNNPVEFYAGQSFVTNDDVVDVFEAPPEEIRMSESETQKVRWGVQVLDGGFPASLYGLEAEGELAQALQLARALSAVSPEKSQVHDVALGFVREFAAKDAPAFRKDLERRFGTPDRWDVQA